MQQITFEVTDRSKLEALKAYAATLGEINIIEEDEEFFIHFRKRNLIDGWKKVENKLENKAA